MSHRFFGTQFVYRPIFLLLCLHLQFSASPSKTNRLAGATRDNVSTCVVHNGSQPESAEVKVISMKFTKNEIHVVPNLYICLFFLWNAIFWRIFQLFSSMKQHWTPLISLYGSVSLYTIHCMLHRKKKVIQILNNMIFHKFLGELLRMSYSWCNPQHWKTPLKVTS